MDEADGPEDRAPNRSVTPTEKDAHDAADRIAARYHGRDSSRLAEVLSGEIETADATAPEGRSDEDNDTDADR